jgi:hypothetical protein
MKVKKHKFKINTSNYSFKFKEGGRRMKMYIKLNKEETEQWTAVKTAVLGEAEADTNQFAKFLFFKGLGAFMDEVTESVEALSEEERKEIIEETRSEMVDFDNKELELEVGSVEKEETDEKSDEVDEGDGEGTEPSSKE